MYLHPAILLVACLLIASCRDDYHPEGLQQSLSAWQSKIDELPVGTTEEEVKTWLRRHQLNISRHESTYFTNKLPGGYFPIENEVFRLCVSWSVSLEIVMDAQNRVQKKTVTPIGRCL